MTTVTINEGDSAKALAALYNASQLQGMGFMQAKSGLMTEAAAQEKLDRSNYVDYFNGKVIKVDFRTNELRLGLFDRDNGYGAAKAALENAGVSFVGVV